MIGPARSSTPPANTPAPPPVAALSTISVAPLAMLMPPVTVAVYTDIPRRLELAVKIRSRAMVIWPESPSIAPPLTSTGVSLIPKAPASFGRTEVAA